VESAHPQWPTFAGRAKVAGEACIASWEKIMIRYATIALAGLLAGGSAASAQTPVERGSYLVNSILTCGNCHTPRGPGGVFDMAKQLSGGPQTFDEPNFTVKGANITPDNDTGIGKWTAADIKRALLEGKRPDGSQLAPIMPYGFYKVFTAGDLDAVAAYLKSVPALSNKVAAPVYKAGLSAKSPPGADKAMSEADMQDPVKRGFYLATVGHCMECHTPRVSGEHDFQNLGKGGQEFKGPWGSVLSRNITSHKDKGIGDWSDAEVKRAITEGVRKDGTKLKGPMGFPLYAKLTEADLGAVVAYLRTVPAKE
jgi:mono/diheme cytochrome c family protein